MCRTLEPRYGGQAIQGLKALLASPPARSLKAVFSQRPVSLTVVSCAGRWSCAMGSRPCRAQKHCLPQHELVASTRSSSLETVFSQ